MNLQPLLEARPTRRADLAGWYRELLAAADAENVPLARLATLVGCTESNLQQRRRMIAAEDAGEPRLVRALPATSHDTASPARIEIRTPSGLTVAVPAFFDRGALVAILEVIGQC